MVIVIIIIIIIIIIILMTREAGVAYKSIKYKLCNLKADCTNLAKEFTTVVFLDVNRWINLSLVERYMKLGWNLSMAVYVHPSGHYIQDRHIRNGIVKVCTLFHLCVPAYSW